MNPGPTPSPDYPLRMRPDGNTARAAAVPAVVLLVVAVVIGSLVARPAAAQEDGGTDTTVEPTAGATKASDAGAAGGGAALTSGWPAGGTFCTTLALGFQSLVAWPLACSVASPVNPRSTKGSSDRVT